MDNNFTQLRISRAPGPDGKIVNIASTQPQQQRSETENGIEKIFWIDMQHGKRHNKAGIVLKLIQCPFASSTPIRFYVDLCNDLNKDLSSPDKNLPERFCQIVRRELTDPQYYPVRDTPGGTFLRFIGHPKKYIDGSICSVRGILTRRENNRAFGVPKGETLGDFNVNGGDREENYEDDFMVGFALGLSVDSLEPHGMRLIRNDLAQLRMYNGYRELPYEEKHTYRLVVTYAQRHLIGNFKHFLRKDEIGTRVPHRLTMPLEEARFQVPPLSADELEVPRPPSAIPVVVVDKDDKTGITPDVSQLTLNSGSPGKKELTGLEPHLIHKYPFDWEDAYYEDAADDPLMAPEPKYSLDSLTGAIAQRNQLRRERSPPVSPSDNPQEREVKYRKSY